jgi:hypothetical protein
MRVVPSVPWGKLGALFDLDITLIFTDSRSRFVLYICV